jgi:hypothetical protein
VTVDLAAFAEARDAEYLIVGQLIVDELAPVLDGLVAREARAEEALRKACEAVKAPQERLRALDAEMARAEGKAAGLRAQTGDPRIAAEDRIRARTVLQGWEEELSALRARRDQAAADLEPFTAECLAAGRALESAFAAKVTLAVAMADPFRSELGQQTRAYKALGIPFRVSEIIMLHDRDHPEWEAAIDHLEMLCRASGYRTDGTSGRERLPVDAEMWRKFWQDVYRDANPAERAPSGAEVIGQAHAEMENAALARQGQAARQDIEDHRLKPVRIPARLCSPRRPPGITAESPACNPGTWSCPRPGPVS